MSNFGPAVGAFRIVVAVAGFVVGCAPVVEEPVTVRPTQSPTSPALRDAISSAADGVDDPRLADLLREHWQWTLQHSPLRATRLGVRDYDHQLANGSEAARSQSRAETAQFLEASRAIDRSALSQRDDVTKRLFEASLAADLDEDVCKFEYWNLGASNNPVSRYNELPELHQVDTLLDAENLLARYRAIEGSVDTEIELLRSGLRQGLIANAATTQRVIALVERQLALPLADWALMTPASKPHPQWPEDRQAWFANEIAVVVGGLVRQSWTRYRDLLRSEIAPQARPQDRTGLAALELGPACYAALVQRYTSLPLSAQTLHDTGLAEIQRIDAQFVELGRRALGTEGLAETLTRLRSDRSLFFDTSQEVEAAAVDALEAAKRKMPEFFGRLPKANCVVRRVPDYSAPFTTIAYYQPPHADGSKPGEYFVNVFAPNTRPRYEARVLAVHESIPGHHLQIALAQDLGDLPAFRRYGGYTVFVEGWALYTERLADQMGLYENDMDRFGMLSFDAWRAARLVVDTGIHALGWSREQAQGFLQDHTALADNNIANEVDRYIGWPGQALAYKTGQLEIRRLRARAQSALGERFELAAFHDAILDGGAVTIPVLRERFEAYLRRAQG